MMTQEYRYPFFAEKLQEKNISPNKRLLAVEELRRSVLAQFEEKSLEEIIFILPSIQKSYISLLQKSQEVFLSFNEWEKSCLNKARQENGHIIKAVERNPEDILSRYLIEYEEKLSLFISNHFPAGSKEINEFGSLYMFKFLKKLIKGYDWESNFRLYLESNPKVFGKIPNKGQIRQYFLDNLSWKNYNRLIPSNSRRFILCDNKKLDTFLTKGRDSSVYNAKCFFERDSKGCENYFSINQLLNDVQVLGLEMGYPQVNLNSITQETANELFPKLQLVIDEMIKSQLIKDILNKECHIYLSLKDYNFSAQGQNEYRSWFLFEKLLERIFRDLINNQNNDYYQMSIKTPNACQDKCYKTDLIVSLIDKELKETRGYLQATLQDDNKEKELFITNKQKTVKGGILIRNIYLNLFLESLATKVKVWRATGRPIGSFAQVLSDQEIRMVKCKFRAIVKELAKR